jgi:hypothetical protein
MLERSFKLPLTKSILIDQLVLVLPRIPNFLTFESSLAYRISV